MKRRIDTTLGLGILAVLLAGLFGLLAWRDSLHLTNPRVTPMKPWRIDWLVTAPDARASVLPRGARLEPSGRLTILEAPPSPGKPVPLVPGTVHWAQLAQPFDRAPPGMKAGIRLLPTIRPIPRDEIEEDRLWVGGAEYGGGRLVLVDGCFRMDGPKGPLLVFPFGTRLGLRDGWLMVGPPGLPPGSSARVGEKTFWEGSTFRNFRKADVAHLRRVCGPGEVESVLPRSESVQVAEGDGFAATRTANEQGISWDEAMRPIRACRAREARGGLKLNEHCRVPISAVQPSPAPRIPGQPVPPAPPPPPRPTLR